MQVFNNNNINFKAQYIATKNISKKMIKSYRDIDVDIVELKSNDKNDLKTMRNLAIRWKNSFASAIERAFLYSEKSPNEHFYALTLPQDSYEKLDAQKVLGICDIVDTDPFTKLDFLQTKPKYINANKKSEYASIGSTLVDFIKSREETEKIRVLSLKDAMPFYEKKDFKHQGDIPDNTIMFWEKGNI